MRLQPPQKLYLNKWIALDSIEHLKSFNHLVTFNYQQQQVMIFQGEVSTKKGLTLVGLSEIGIPLFELYFHNQTARFEPRVNMQLPIPPSWLVESMQLIFASEAQVREKLHKHCTMEQTNTRRNIRCDNKTALNIEYHFEKTLLKSVKYQPLNTQLSIEIQILEN